MAIPDHVKRQAMDAVSHRETTEFMRRYGYSTDSISLFSATPAAQKSSASGPLNDNVRRLAMDAVTHRETTAHIHLVEHSGSVFAPTTPSRTSHHSAQLVNDLHRSGAEIDAVQRQVTQDGFGRSYE